MAPTLVQTLACVLALGGFASALPNGSILQKRALVVPDGSTLPGLWRSLGCYLDPGPRTLQGAGYVNATGMTDESCVTYCDTQGFNYAGTEYSQECYCGNSLVTNTSTPITDCSMACKGNATEACGGPNRLNLFWSGKQPPPGPVTNPGPPGWSLLGCYAEGTTGRALPNGMNVGAPLTVALCTFACKNANYQLAGVEYAGECYCGNTIANGGAPAPGGISDCNMVCNGNSSEFCGAGNRLDVYTLGPVSSSTSTGMSPSSPSSTKVPSISSTSRTTSPTAVSSSSRTSSSSSTAGSSRASSSPGSSSATRSSSTSSSSKSSSSSRTSSSGSTAGSSRTSSSLGSSATKSSSTSSNTSKASLSSSSTAKLSTTLGTVSPTSTPTSTSSVATPTQTGPIHVPSVDAYSWIGCYTEATGSRALTGAAHADYQLMTVEMCKAFCSSPTQYTYFGVEYHGECYCGNTLQAGSVVAPTTDCGMLCDGSHLEYCGGGNRLDMYKLGGSVSTGSTVSPTASSTASTTSSIPTVTGLPPGWKYDGCYKEGVGGRAIGFEQPDSQGNSIETCIQTCIGLGYTVAGLEYGVQCFCDNFMKNGPVLAPETDCSFACPGNPSEKCGAGDRLSVYNKGELVIHSIPTIQKTGLPGNWQYSGCITDNVAQVRAMFWQIILTNNNTATNCLSLCSKYGYMSGGMEYGIECYCGDASMVQSSGSTLRPDSECATPCSGDPQAICGDGNRIAYYTWQGTPLYNWHSPQGGAAGQYQFFVPGVVVPLMTSLTIKGKVTFLEKHGTGAPNSTGAYELDPSLVNNFSAAWRTMNLKTDVFCSAGLTLPDKAGRQITVGGWSGESSFGIRLYTPDGAPGVPSTNDWQENVNELSLQTPRWYPSIMMLANGSILVIGGEVGANAAPSPSLEILPNPPGGKLKNLDWLQRTDPNNLYPVPYVLPSGGIVVLYYNEARILDPVTFDTIKVLPNMPGSVNNFLAGRSYPLEGTGFMLPQHAPYTEPVTVIACGGSSVGAGQAIDNCVSIQPEVDGAQWLIERMPSQRVLTCVAALPDGTYMILNGAKAGVAGFGLATNPNLGAVLFDPSQPIGSRFSIMANTIVARLYHSEAILLQDGRVLVSGSDPQDGVHPQEYRVEVFVPPYLLSGLTQPTFTITKTDWAYGEQVPITVHLFQGTTATMKVSLVAAVSSTHGNSMGMRTLFPAFTCAGNVCTITAPPNANVSPPTWYQLFILDGPTPSFSHWVRIGGDPGKLGLWPDLPDFSKPGWP